MWVLSHWKSLNRNPRISKGHVVFLLHYIMIFAPVIQDAMMRSINGLFWNSSSLEVHSETLQSGNFDDSGSQGSPQLFQSSMVVLEISK